MGIILAYNQFEDPDIIGAVNSVDYFNIILLNSLNDSDWS